MPNTLTRVSRGMPLRTCEICSDRVDQLVKGTTCNHLIYLCRECRRTCPGALRLCVKCEDKGVNPEPRTAR